MKVDRDSHCKHYLATTPPPNRGSSSLLYVRLKNGYFIGSSRKQIRLKLVVSTCLARRTASNFLPKLTIRDK